MSTLEVKKNKVEKIFRFMKELNELRNPVATDLSHYDWTLNINKDLPKIKECQSSFIDEKFDYVLKIRKPELTLNSNAEDEELNAERQKCIELYESLFTLHSLIQKNGESIEIILGDGVLSWDLEDKRSIKHPILLQKLELKFDPTIPEFIIQVQEGNTELYTSLIRTIDSTDKKKLGEMIDNLKVNNYQIMDTYETNKFLEDFMSSVIKNSEQAHIHREPLIFLRKRTHGYSTMIDAIIEDIKNKNEFTGFIDKIIGEDDEEQEEHNKIITSGVDVNGIDRDILLSKAANKEQLYVAKLLERYSAVLVQGPPGTGKTHTIANILGHLLSQGKSILVTSHTEKALTVLKDKIQNSIQPLCLSVTGSRENHKDMDTTFSEMNIKRANMNESDINEEIKSLDISRNKYLDDLKELREVLLSILKNEYENIIVEGKSYSPIKAAKMIKENENELTKIPSQVKYGEEFPLNNDELSWLYSSNALVTIKEEKELYYDLPKVEDLILPEEFKKSTDDINDYERKLDNWNNVLWEDSIKDCKSFEKLALSIENFREELMKLDEIEIELIEAGINRGATFDRWRELFKMVIDLKKDAEAVEKVYLNYNPHFKFQLDYQEALKYTNEIINHIKADKKLNKFILMMKKPWKEIIDNSTVNDRVPQSLYEFIALKNTIEYKVKSDLVFTRWSRQIPAESELNSINDVKIAFIYVKKFENLFSLYSEKWIPITKELKAHSFKWEQFSSKIEKSISQHAEVDLLKSYMNADLYGEVTLRFFELKQRELKAKISDKVQTLRKYIIDKDSQTTAIVHALENYDVEEYSRAYESFVELINKTKIIEKKRDLIVKIKSVATNWADAIINRSGVHGELTPPENINFAWIIRQLNDELDRRHKLDIEEIQHQIKVTENNLINVTEQLVDRKAWFEKVSKITQPQTQAIEGWRVLMKKIGLGTGKRAPKLLAEARKLMPICQTAVPIWVMPLSKVVETFDPAINQFDVVIIDEASQADIMAMNAIYLAKQVIIVGDDEQVSPTAVGQDLNQVQALIDTYLDGIPNAQLYDGNFSIYDLARTSGFKPVTLTEHFRCLTPIINFSNHLSYEGIIKPLRDESKVNISPPLVEYKVQSGEAKGKVNIKETETIAAMILAASKLEEYNGKTFGVISLVGDKQAAHIDRILQRKMDPLEYLQRRIQCGNSAAFQGDERDVIFLSMVDSPKKDGNHLSLRSAEANEIFKKRYNVAASRAKDQMWVVHSLDLEKNLKENDIRASLIKHAQNPYICDANQSENAKRIESTFEEEVRKKLTSAGFIILPQYKVGGYSIDIMVEGFGKRLAVECDGEKWYTADTLNEAMHSQAILERLGWNFVRIKGSEYYKDPENAINKVFDRLNKLEIKPELYNMNDFTVHDNDYSLSDKVVSLAQDILKSWNEE